MSIERKLITFDGGARPVPDSKPLNCPDEIINYEELQKGILEKRKEPIVFEASFDTAVKTAFNVLPIPPRSSGNVICYAPEPFYPANLPFDIAEGYDYLIPVYGHTGTEYRLYLFYKATRGGSDVWVHQTADTPAVDLLQGIYDDGVVFTSNSKLRFSYDKDLLYIVDDVNNLFFITTNEDGNVVSAKCGIPAPRSRPIITAMVGWQDQYFEEDNIGDSLGDIGLVRVLYSCATKEGYKSNPSGASEYVDFQWLKLDAGSQDRWLKKFQVTNVKIPDGINDYIKSELKYFDFYFEILRYSEGLDTQSFGFSCRKEIFDKDGANSYTIAIPASASILADWENDVAPIAKDLVAFDGKVVLAQVKDKLKFPFEFDNIWKIKLNNQDNKTYVDAVIRTRLYDKNSSDSKKIEDLDWDTFDSYENDIIDNSDKLRIYDSDLTTPISVVYVLDTSAHYCDVYIKIPQLQASSIHTVYFCFGGNGINGNATYQTATYGKWIHLKDWSEQKVFQPRKVTDENCLICSPMDEEDWAEEDEIPNKANSESKGSMIGCEWNAGNQIAFLPDLNKYIGTDSILFGDDWDNNVKFGKIDLDNTNKVKASIYTKINLNNLVDESVGAYAENIIFGNYISESDNSHDKLNGWIVNIKVPNGTVNAYMEVIIGDTDDSDNTQRILFDDIDLGALGHSLLNLFILVNINFDSKKVYLFVYEAYDGLLINEEKSFSFAGEYNISGNMEVTLGKTGDPFASGALWMVLYSIKQIQYDQFLYETNRYDNDINTSLNTANFMPAFDNMIGYVYDDPDNPGNDKHNKGVTFEKVDNSLKAKNILRWSKKGGFAFPDTYYKSGIPSPIVRIVHSLSTLALQSQNVIKIYLRNGLYKFIAKGDPASWADLSDNLVRQNPRLGLVQQDALAVTPYGEFHLSEAGVIQWIGDRLNIVTNIKDEDGEHPIINIPMDKVLIFFYCPLRRQLFIQEKFEERFLVNEQGFFITKEDGTRIKLRL